ncbi:hypothetical protein DPV73_03245 [Leptospira mayottensis]|nr:hypothetical protein DPV73_03245 [Leptospira mayottensis]
MKNFPSFKTIHKQRLCTLKFKCNESIEILPIALSPSRKQNRIYPRSNLQFPIFRFLFPNPFILYSI